MTEEARDKAVEEALNHLHRSGGSGVDDMTTLGTLWQRAQEARDFEWWRELVLVDNVPMEPQAAKHFILQLHADEVVRAQEAERESDGWVDAAAAEIASDPGTFGRVSEARASIAAILRRYVRNRSAARTSEEPKP